MIFCLGQYATIMHFSEVRKENMHYLAAKLIAVGPETPQAVIWVSVRWRAEIGICE